MQFHNSPACRYHVLMLATTPAPGTLLGRLRASAWLAVLMLLVFTMKIGLAAACAKHDFADLGLSYGVSPETVMTAAQADTDGGEPTKGSLPHAGTCTHCGCHHAAAVPVSTCAMTMCLAKEGFGYAPDTAHSAPTFVERRPPIT